MLTKDAVRSMVHALLFEQVESALLRAEPDLYYGYVTPKTRDDGTVEPGYWMGAEDKRLADHAVVMAKADFDRAADRLVDLPVDHPAYAEAKAAADTLAQTYRTAVQRRDTVEVAVERAIVARRELVIERRVAKLFSKVYRKALVLEWDLFHSAIPQDLREYVQRQRARGVVAPTSLVLLYLVVRHTIEHGEEHQLAAVSGDDYLARNPLVQATLNIEAVENEPTKQQRQYVKALQASAAAVQPPAHANGDPRDALADFEYHGLPEQLGALWIDKDDGCETCGQPLRVRMVHAKHGYRYATVCSNYHKGCHYEPQTPIFATRQDVRDYAVVEWATAVA